MYSELMYQNILKAKVSFPCLSFTEKEQKTILKKYFCHSLPAEQTLNKLYTRINQSPSFTNDIIGGVILPFDILLPHHKKNKVTTVIPYQNTIKKLWDTKKIPVFIDVDSIYNNIDLYLDQLSNAYVLGGYLTISLKDNSDDYIYEQIKKGFQRVSAVHASDLLPFVYIRFTDKSLHTTDAEITLIEALNEALYDIGRCEVMLRLEPPIDNTLYKFLNCHPNILNTTCCSNSVDHNKISSLLSTLQLQSSESLINIIGLAHYQNDTTFDLTLKNNLNLKPN